jgi:HEAT repeat protein
MIRIFLGALLLFGQTAPEEFEKLDSDTIGERESAFRKLKARGVAVLPDAEARLANSRGNQAVLLARLVKTIRIGERIPGAVKEAFPQADEHLALGELTWAKLFLNSVEEDGFGTPKCPRIPPKEVELLALEAVKERPDLRNRERTSDFNEVIRKIVCFDFRSAVPVLLEQLDDAVPEVRLRSIGALGLLNAENAVPRLVARAPQAKDGELQEILTALENLNGLARLPKEPFHSNPLVQIEAEVRAVRGGERTALRGLVALVESRDPDIRARAALALLDLDARDSGPAVAPLLAHEDEGVRMTAARLAGLLELRECREGLRKILGGRDADDLKEAAVKALLKIGDTSPDPEMIRILSSTPRLLASLDRKTAVAELLRILRNEDASWNVKSDALETLATLEKQEALPVIERHLKDEDPLVRCAAIRSLLGAGPPEGWIARVVPLLNDPDERVRNVALDALQGRKATEAASGFLKLLGDTEPRNRILAAAGVAELGLRDGVKPLKALIEDSAVSVRVAAAGALARLGDEVGRSVLDGLVRSEDYGVAYEAAVVLKDLNVADAGDRMVNLLGSKVPASRRLAVRQLALWQGARAVPRLRDLLQDPDYGVRLGAAKWLCHLGEKDGVPILLEANRSLTFLNAVRNPEAWRRLFGKEQPPGPTLAGIRSVRTDVELWSREGGLGLRWGIPNWGEREAWGYPEVAESWGLSNLASRLEYFFEDGRYEAILEKQSIRVVPRHEGVLFWTRWSTEGCPPLH